MRHLLSKFVRDDRAAAAAELALSLPLLLVLLWGPLEIGNYFFNEHILVKGVRDGATYAAHQDITKYNCATNTIDATVVSNTKNMVRSGAISGGTDRLRNWGSATFTMTLQCVTQSDDATTTLGGIYKHNGGLVPIIQIEAGVAYSPIIGNLGFRPPTLSMTAKQEATVMGI